MTAPAPALTAEALRERFPALAGPVVRLDGPGASQTPQSVIDAMVGYLTAANANLGGVFGASVATGDLSAAVRVRAAAFFGTDDPGEVGFGLNASTLNEALVAAATAGLAGGDEIVVTALDHHANTEPWHRAAARHHLVVRTIGVDGEGRLDMAGLERALGDRTRIVAFPYANNATGTMVDVAAVTQAAHMVGAIAWGDPTHWAPHGTPPFESLAALVAAFDYLDEAGWDFIAGHERDLAARFLAGLPEPWRLHGLPGTEGRTATFTVTLPGADPADLAKDLAARGFAVGAGTFHAPDIFSALGQDGGAIRIGFLHYNTAAEVDALLSALAAIAAS